MPPVSAIVLLGLFLWRQHALGDITRSVGHLAALLVRSPIGLVFLVLVAWIVGLVLGAQHAGLWAPDMAKDTVLSLVPAYAMMMKASEATWHDCLYRRQVGRLIRWIAVVEVFVGQVTYILPAEVFLVVFLSIVGACRRSPAPTSATRGGSWASAASCSLPPRFRT